MNGGPHYEWVFQQERKQICGDPKDFDDITLEQIVMFNFETSNNQVEYKTNRRTKTCMGIGCKAS